MKTATKFNFKTFSVFVLSVLLCFTLAFSAACNNQSSSSSSSAEETVVNPTDTQLVSNGDFEFSTFATDTKFPVSSSISWSLSRDSKNSSSAISSDGNSGIIDTKAEADKYEEAAKKAKLPKDGENYYNPGTLYDYNIKEESEYFVFDKETKNSNEDKLPMKGSKVLMISNITAKDDTPDEFTGTAQKFTSTSSLSLGKNEYARLSVWVKTKNLRFRYNQTGVGAYIAVQNTVSSSCDPFVIKGINTEKNGVSQWVKYTIYLRSSDFATSSFKVTLGLGFGNRELREEYVEGHAFFDDVNFEKIEYADYIAGVNATAVENKFNLYEQNSDKTYSKVPADDLKTVALNDYTATNDAESGKKFDEVVYSLSHYRTNEAFGDMFSGYDGAIDSTIGVAGVASASDIKTVIGSDLKAPYGDDFTSDTFYAKLTKAGKYECETQAFEVPYKSYKKVSFWVKSHLDKASRPGLTIEVKDLGEGDAQSPKSSSLASNLNTDKVETFNGWTQYTVYVSNTVSNSNKTRKFSVKFTFGDESDDEWKMAVGYFLVTDAEICELTEDDYSIASTTSNAVKVSLTADMPNGGKTDESDDSYYFGYNASSANLIEKDAAVSVNGYKGIYYDADNGITVGSKEGVTAGVINTKNFTSTDAYTFLTADEKTAIESLGKLGENKYLQPLVIKSNGSSYGYFGSDITISANSTTLIKVKVKVVGNAKATVYLAKSDALDGFPVLTVAGKNFVKNSDGSYEETNEYKVNEKLATTVTAADCNKVDILDDGWFTVMFVVTTGNESITLRPELWNGARDSADTASGLVLFDNLEQSSVTAETFENEELKTYYGDVVNEASVKTYTRFPTKILSTEDGKQVVNYRTYKETTVFSVYTKTKAIVASYETIDAVREIDNTTSGDSSSSSSSSSSGASSDFSWALQLSSIIIAVVLILLLVAVLIRMLVKKARAGKQATKEYYNRDSREKLQAQLEDKKDSQPEEVKPYDYDNIENNIANEEENKTEEQAAETVENAENAENVEAPADENAEAETTNENGDDNAQ